MCTYVYRCLGGCSSCFRQLELASMPHPISVWHKVASVYISLSRVDGFAHVCLDNSWHEHREKSTGLPSTALRKNQTSPTEQLLGLLGSHHDYTPPSVCLCTIRTSVNDTSHCRSMSHGVVKHSRLITNTTTFARCLLGYKTCFQLPVLGGWGVIEFVFHKKSKKT